MKATPGPWRVEAHPILKGRHPLHDNRYIMTSDAVIEKSPNADRWEGRSAGDWDLAWSLSKGSIICEMRDTKHQANDAALIAACPDLYSALKNLVSFIDPRPDDEPLGTAYVMAKKALARADGRE